MEEMLGSMSPCPRIVRGQQSLTPQQEEYVRQFAQERIARMLASTAIDEQEAEAHLREAYQVARLSPPATISWFDSPIHFLLACLKDDSEWVNVSIWKDVRHSVMEHVCLGHDVWKSVSENVFSRVWASLHENMWAIMASASASLGDRAGINVGGSVRVNVKESVWASVGESFWERVRENWDWEYVHALAEASVEAYFDANWLAEYRFFHEVFEENTLIHQALFNEMVSGFRLGSKEAWLVHKPILLECDEQGRFHSASGRCLQYRDGWGFYAWHGVRVPEKIILHSEQFTREDWLQEHNLEVRRVIQERLGNDRFVELVGGRCIDTCTRGNLIEVDLGNDPEGVAHYVQIRDASTQRQYSLRVPPSIRRADEAVAWTFGLDEQDYQPKQET